MKKTLYLTVLLIFILSFNIVYSESYEEPEIHMETGVVIEAGKVQDEGEVEGYSLQYQDVKLKITSGKYKNKVVDIENHLSDNTFYNIIVKKGDKVVVSIEESGDEHLNVSIADYSRQNHIFYLAIIFIALIIIIGRKKGLKAVLSLGITMFAILKILLPMMLKGKNPIPITIIISIGITLITMFIISGINNKSIAAILGTSGGVLIAGLIAYYVGNKAKLTGLSSEEAMMLTYIPQKVNFNFNSLLFSGIILGSLGAVMDVGISISSSMEEVYNANKDLTRKELFSAGMNVGKDVMGTMTNTLILAYTGSSIPLLLLFMAHETSIIKILNLDIIATEVIRSIAGSIGLVLTIPLTAFISSLLISRYKDKEKTNNTI
ncbi:YibE/F family protein [Anaerosalibacter massiliensis]|uniref:YibE/F family protein n=1 Tax=Anaerosalibacter massiliensis TaxID=1347392 RepID=A0A9X2S428_9FIRM|nr:YibE/F family protein [Anaerosalibacter massiliensis]MCR2043305.1 YibE/F family protein [Anaerosalibacter massiliensis]